MIEGGVALQGYEDDDHVGRLGIPGFNSLTSASRVPVDRPAFIFYAFGPGAFGLRRVSSVTLPAVVAFEDARGFTSTLKLRLTNGKKKGHKDTVRALCNRQLE